MTWKVVYTKQTQKDAKKLVSSGMKTKAKTLVDILKEDPYLSPPAFEKLIGDLSGAYSRRINIQHRIVYQILESEKVVKVLRLWSHFGDWILPYKVNEVGRNTRAVLRRLFEC